MYEKFREAAIKYDKRNSFSAYSGNLDCFPVTMREFYKNSDPVDIEIDYDGLSVRFSPACGLTDLQKEYSYIKAQFIFATCNGDPIFLDGGAIYTCSHDRGEKSDWEKLADSFDSYLEKFSLEEVTMNKLEVLFTKLFQFPLNRKGKSLEEYFGAVTYASTLSLAEIQEWIKTCDELLTETSKATVLKINDETLKSLGKDLDLESGVGNMIVIAIVDESDKNIKASILMKYEHLDGQLDEMLECGKGVLIIER